MGILGSTIWSQWSIDIPRGEKNAGKYQPHSGHLDGRKHGESAFHEDEGATPNTSQNND